MKLFLIIIALSFSAHSATLVTDSNGQLLGINNVSINGQYWDAEFDTSTNYPITVLYCCMTNRLQWMQVRLCLACSVATDSSMGMFMITTQLRSRVVIPPCMQVEYDI